MSKTMKVPSNALMFGVPHDDTASFSMFGDEQTPKLKITGYSGGVIEDHWYWGNLVIDTEGMSFPKDSYPVLLDHDTDKRIAFSGKPTITPNHGLFIETDNVLSNEYSKSFINDSKQNFPFQASIRVKPTKIKHLDENEKVFVNGFEFKGPGTVFAKSTYMEVSACVFGWDSNTSSTAFSRDETELHVEEDMAFDTELWKKEDPEAYAAFCKKIADEASAPLMAELAKRDEKITELSANMTESDTRKAELETRLAKLERDMALRTEAAHVAAFTRIVSTAATALPEHMRGKFAKMFTIDTYRTEDGAIDETKLSAAVDAELKEWESAFSTSAPVIGGGADVVKEAPAEFSMTDEDYAKMAFACGITASK